MPLAVPVEMSVEGTLEAFAPYRNVFQETCSFSLWEIEK